jgi:dipeptidyl aminopeptidase/acylaminoacyl peptidase
VRVWDAITGQEAVPPLRGHTGEVCAVAYSPDAKKLASASFDKTVRVWDATTGQLLHRLEGHEWPVHCVAFSPDGRRLVSGAGDGTVRVWDLTTGGEVPFSPLTGHTAGINSVAYSPDGRRLASACEGSIVRVWDAATGKAILIFDDEHLGAAASSGATAVAFSPDRLRLAMGSLEGLITVRDAATGRILRTLTGHTSGVTSVAFTPDGTRLASADVDCKLNLWDARPWTPEAAIEREALGLLDSLFARPLRKADVIDYLQNARTIRPRARQPALSLLEGYHEETNPETYHRSSWAVVRQPYLNAFQYRFAQLQAEHACRLAPDRREYRIGLGTALYRAGCYLEAIETLKRADRPDQNSSATLAFLAMTHHRLGEREQARAAVSRLREWLKKTDQAQNDEARAFLPEVEAIEPDLAFPIDPFVR